MTIALFSVFSVLDRCLTLGKCRRVRCWLSLLKHLWRLRALPDEALQEADATLADIADFYAERQSATSKPEPLRRVVQIQARLLPIREQPPIVLEEPWGWEYDEAAD